MWREKEGLRGLSELMQDCEEVGLLGGLDQEPIHVQVAVVRDLPINRIATDADDGDVAVCALFFS